MDNELISFAELLEQFGVTLDRQCHAIPQWQMERYSKEDVLKFKERSLDLSKHSAIQTLSYWAERSKIDPKDAWDTVMFSMQRAVTAMGCDKEHIAPATVLETVMACKNIKSASVIICEEIRKDGTPTVSFPELIIDKLGKKRLVLVEADSRPTPWLETTKIVSIISVPMSPFAA